MTQQAIDHVYTMLAERGHGIGLRLGIKTMGCSGYAYNIDFLDEVGANDRVFDINNDIKVAVDTDSFKIIKGTTIDFVREGLSRQFKFINPNIQDLCGCGESFSVKQSATS
ncbi:MAG: iron-sulfur cluster assembly accessory protein [Gammaproteobacteria bacterium]|nr:iron-sulfur cluster assembly accessory protein [Gammaproteobacteria bacterium]